MARLSWPGWLVIYQDGFSGTGDWTPDTVTHPSNNWARRGLTSLIETNVLTTTPNRQPQPLTRPAADLEEKGETGVRFPKLVQIDYDAKVTFNSDCTINRLLANFAQTRWRNSQRSLDPLTALGRTTEEGGARAGGRELRREDREGGRDGKEDKGEKGRGGKNKLAVYVPPDLKYCWHQHLNRHVTISCVTTWTIMHLRHYLIGLTSQTLWLFFFWISYSFLLIFL